MSAALKLNLETENLSRKPPLGEKRPRLRLVWENPKLSCGTQKEKPEVRPEPSYGRVLYNYFRYYDPSTGRYITSDPIGLDGGLNTYTYVKSNLLRWTDLFGLKRVVKSVIERWFMAVWYAPHITGEATQKPGSAVDGHHISDMVFTVEVPDCCHLTKVHQERWNEGKNWSNIFVGWNQLVKYTYVYESDDPCVSCEGDDMQVEFKFYDVIAPTHMPSLPFSRSTERDLSPDSFELPPYR